MAKCLLVILLCAFGGAHCDFYVEDEKPPTFLTAAVGDYIVMNCDLDFPQSMPIPYILNWNKENKTVFTWYDGRITSVDPYVGRLRLIEENFTQRPGDASIILSAITESDAGWYECEVLFPNRMPNSRNNGTWFYLTVNGNLLAIPPVNQTVKENGEVHFSCVKKHPDTIVTWCKNGMPLKELPDIFQRSWITEGGSLSISPVAIRDLGEYECEAIRPNGEKQTATAYLNVLYKAKVIYVRPEVHLQYGRPANVDCHYIANPPLTNLIWKKDGVLFDPYLLEGVSYRRNGSLYFSKVNETYTGHYTCTPYNELGTDGPSTSIHVIVQKPPVFVITPSESYYKKLGETLKISCDARDGITEHKPIIVWYKKDKTALPLGRYFIRDGNLTIINIQEEDEGIYQCSATNEAATISTETELIVENVSPRAPYNLSADSTTTSVHLKWAGRRNPDIEYSIWYRSVDIPEWRTLKIFSDRALETSISNLNAGREYEFMVVSKDNQGYELFSKTLRVWTKGFIGDSGNHYATGVVALQQIGAPRNLHLRYYSGGGYLVTWDPPSYGSNQIKLYVVRWYQGPREFLYGSAETKNTSYLVTNLEKGYDYRFQVLAIAFNDYQAASDKITISVPSYAQIRAISLGLLLGIIVLGGLAGGAFYARRKYWKRFEDEDRVSEQ